MSEAHPFQPGFQTTVDGIGLRVVRGKKATMKRDRPDMRLEWFIGGNWIPVSMELSAFLADFFYENEENRYPQEMGYLGGKFYLRWLRLATTQGWVAAVAQLRRYRDGMSVDEGVA